MKRNQNMTSIQLREHIVSAPCNHMYARNNWRYDIISKFGPSMKTALGQSRAENCEKRYLYEQGSRNVYPGVRNLVKIDTVILSIAFLV